MVESHAIAYIVLSDGSIIGSAAVVQGDSSPQSYQSDQGGGQ
jgi:acetyltransferase-like isoleucine patch superfamily enzyme